MVISFTVTVNLNHTAARVQLCLHMSHVWHYNVTHATYVNKAGHALSGWSAAVGVALQSWRDVISLPYHSVLVKSKPTRCTVVRVHEVCHCECTQGVLLWVYTGYAIVSVHGMYCYKCTQGVLLWVCQVSELKDLMSLSLNYAGNVISATQHSSGWFPSNICRKFS